MRLVFGTTNKAKLRSMTKRLAPLGIEVIGLCDIDTPVPDVEEEGNSPLENARQKARAYYAALHMPVFSCDSGLYFDDIPDSEQPGVHVRHVGGNVLTDAEMTEYYADMAARHGGSLIARYRNAICLVTDEEHIYESMDEKLSGKRFKIISKPHPRVVEGFPLDRISVRMDNDMYFYDYEGCDRRVDSTMDKGFQEFFRECMR